MSGNWQAPDPGHRLLWSLRHHRRAVAVVTLLVVLGTALAVGRLLLAPTQYTATATVLATDLAHSPSSLARLAETMAAEPLVLDSAIAAEDLPYSRESLRDRHVELRPLEDNVLVLVDGVDTDPDLAVRAANGMAEALTAELNRAGPGVGEFRILTRATVAEPEDVLPTLVIYLLAGLVGLVAAVLATVGLLNAFRRPVADPAAAADVGGRPTLAVIDGREWTADGFQGSYQALADVLHAGGVQRVLVLAPQGDAALSQLLARDLHRFLDGSGSIGRHADFAVAATPAAQDGVSTLSVPSGAKAVVVTPEGVPGRSLATAAQRVPENDLAGLVFVTSPARLRREARKQAPRLRR